MSLGEVREKMGRDLGIGNEDVHQLVMIDGDLNVQCKRNSPV